MKKYHLKLTVAAAGIAVVALSGTAFAGQEPYIATVGDDTTIPPFYISPKHQQFLHPNTDPAYFPERFAHRFNADDPEVCHSLMAQTTGNTEAVQLVKPFRTNLNVLTPHNNDGFYSWTVVLPKKPRGNLNLVIQCGILKPEAFQFLGYEAIQACAGETGERIGPGFCSRKLDLPGRNPVRPDWIPRIEATAYAGPFNSFDPFTLTAYRNPGAYSFRKGAGGALLNDAAKQVLDGSSRSKIVLKACMDKSILVKIPVTGQINALGQVEEDLEAGDAIFVHMEVPRGHSMDVYCHAQSLRVQGLGDPATLLP